MDKSKKKKKWSLRITFYIFVYKEMNLDHNLLMMFVKFFTNFVIESDAWNLLEFSAPFFERVAIRRFFIRFIWFLQVTFNIILSFILASNFFYEINYSS